MGRDMADDAQQLPALVSQAQAIWAQAQQFVEIRSTRWNEAVRNRRVIDLNVSALPIYRPVWELIDLNRRLAVWDVLPADTRTGIEFLAIRMPAMLEAARPVSGLRNWFRSAAQKQASIEAQWQMTQWSAWAAAQAPTLQACARALAQAAPTAPTAPETLGQLLASMLPDDQRYTVVIPQTGLASLGHALSLRQQAEKKSNELKSAMAEHGTQLREQQAREVLRATAIDRLKEATDERLSLGPLEQSDLQNVQDVIDYEDLLESIPGIGEITAQRIGGAARTLETMTRERMLLRPNASERTPEMTDILRQAKEALTIDAVLNNGQEDEAQSTHLIAQALAPAGAATDGLLLAARTDADLNPIWQQADLITRQTGAVEQALQMTAQRDDDALWQEFSAAPLPYLDLLESLGFTIEDQTVKFGGLPEEIIDRIRDQELDMTGITHSIRGYQQFAARFVLVQRKVIVGDDMGLGKTAEALAVLSHLWTRRTPSAEPPHFLVICPAAVVANWLRETEKWTDIPAQKLHGDGRDLSYAMWRRSGGIAVTTYGTVDRFDMDAVQLSCVIVDEAHLIKNPGALRSARTSAIIDQADRAALLTGTPLENRVDEFMVLAGYVDMRFRTADWPALAFRQAIAPIYLRRNQVDVLTELPEQVEKEDWVEMTPTDEQLYRAEVLDDNFMGMRRAPLMGGRSSAKVTRLLDILDEVRENGRKALVFSFFRDVLSSLATVLGEEHDVYGPLTGSVPAGKRQDLVDQFAAAPTGAVLLSQIQAGGIGMNVQAASVVVICEPQLKPTIEAQAIARAHRQGQVQTVMVHRLLTDVGTDARLVQLLANKREIFDAYARTSVMAEKAPEAKDISESAIAEQIIGEERERLGLGSEDRR